MKIYQVEELVGITKKNIRFYEDEGLLNPKRDPQNDYRDYSLEDVHTLERIKLLRKLSVPIEEIRQMVLQLEWFVILKIRLPSLLEETLYARGWNGFHLLQKTESLRL